MDVRPEAVGGGGDAARHLHHLNHTARLVAVASNELTVPCRFLQPTMPFFQQSTLCKQSRLAILPIRGDCRYEFPV